MGQVVRRLLLIIGAAGALAVAAAGCGSERRVPASGRELVHSARVSDTVGATPFTVSGRPIDVTTVMLFAPMSRYVGYVQQRLAQLAPELRALHEDLNAGDTSAAERAWLTAHLTWLKIGQDDGQYGAFGTLGGQIDGLSAGDAGGNASPAFTGFHRVEFDLFTRHDLRAAAADTMRLSALVGSIGTRTLSTDLSLTTTSLDAWVLRTHEILEDALRDSLSQDDNDGSDTDLASVGADVTATREMVSVLGGLLSTRDPELVRHAESQLSAIDAALTTAPPHSEPDALPLREHQRIDGAVDAAVETLAPASELMQITGADS